MVGNVATFNYGGSTKDQRLYYYDGANWSTPTHVRLNIEGKEELRNGNEGPWTNL